MQRMAGASGESLGPEHSAESLNGLQGHFASHYVKEPAFLIMKPL